MRCLVMLVAAVTVAVLGPSAVAEAGTIKVGPSQKHKQIADVVGDLRPGDVVEVEGDAVYQGFKIKAKGTQAKPIVIRGVRKNGKRPVIRGGEHTVIVAGGWTTIEGVEITGGNEVCFFNKAHGVVLRDAVVRDCKRHGVLGADDDAGSLTLSYVEVCKSGGEFKGESLKHPIYVATDEKLWPDAVFRMEHSWVHSNNGGNNVKSRALRTELYYNWIEGAGYYEVELIGPETKTGLGPPREDADVVGNVLVNTSDNYVVRVGSDETGASEGRVRFVNNTFIIGPTGTGVARLHKELESVEFYNNVFIHTGKWDRFLRDSETKWVSGRRIRGSHNYVSHDPKKIDNFPAELTDTVYGADACLEDLGVLDLRPRDGSPLADAGTDRTRSDWSPPRALELPAWVPTLHTLPAPGKAAKRVIADGIDIGAFELGSATGPIGKHAAFVDAKRPSKCARKGVKTHRSGGKAEADAPSEGGPLRTPGRARMIGLIGGAVAVVVASVLIAVGIRKGRNGGGAA